MDAAEPELPEIYYDDSKMAPPHCLHTLRQYISPRPFPLNAACWSLIREKGHSEQWLASTTGAACKKDKGLAITQSNNKSNVLFFKKVHRLGL